MCVRQFRISRKYLLCIRLFYFIGSPLRSAISSAIIKLNEEGKILEMKEKWWKKERGGGACMVSLTCLDILLEPYLVFGIPIFKIVFVLSLKLVLGGEYVVSPS